MATRALVAGFLGLELLASIDSDRAAALALLDRAGPLARLLDLLAGLRLPCSGKEGHEPGRHRCVQLLRWVDYQQAARSRHLVRMLTGHPGRAPVPGAAVPALATMLGVLLRNTLLTAVEYRSLAAGRADSAGPATGAIAVTGWITEHRDRLGQRQASDLDLHVR